MHATLIIITSLFISHVSSSGRLTVESPASVGEVHTYLQEYRGIEHFFNHFWTFCPTPNPGN